MIEAISLHIIDILRSGRSKDEAILRLKKLYSEEEINKAFELIGSKADKIKQDKGTGAIYVKDNQAWYVGPDDSDRYWPSYEKLLKNQGWDEESIRSLDQSSTKTLALMSPPDILSFKSKGLVLGYVQSGKTANFTALISKAADAGYKLFIVLSGVHNSLRDQTQRRIANDLLNQHSESWITITSLAKDFDQRSNVNAFLSETSNRKVLGVMKKNKTRLQNLIKWIKSADPDVLKSCPVLIIDDESDQASPNSHSDPDFRTTINKLIIDLLESLPKVSYVGYTATPFANLLIDPNESTDLYPRDFIIDLPVSNEYFGTERIFGRAPLDEMDEGFDGEDMIRIIENSELEYLKPFNREDKETFSISITKSLEEALLYFILSTAARYFRGQEQSHSSMLIHTTVYSKVHVNSASVVQEYLQRISALYENSDIDFLSKIEEIWNKEIERVPALSFGLESVSFSELRTYLGQVLGIIEVVVENGISNDRLDYNKKSQDNNFGKIYIAIGGSLLSRGFTLEGLVVSFFVRGASAYDTLLQMGRWFGYRKGYSDLPRIWLTQELCDNFFDMAGVEIEIRNAIKKYENGHYTPLDIAIPIRTHPSLAITSKLKMQKAVPAQMSFSGRDIQAIIYKYKDRNILQKNIHAVKNLINEVKNKDKIFETKVNGRPHNIFYNVDSIRILKFLNEYYIDPNNRTMPSNLITGYIESQNKLKSLLKWNIVIISRKKSDILGSIDIGLESESNLLNRSRFMRGDDPTLADIKALMSEIDPVVDLDLPLSKFEEYNKRKDLLGLREELYPDTGLLLLYPISKNSKPSLTSSKSNTSMRKELGSDENIIGIALVFPDTRSPTPQQYMTADLSNIEKEYDIDELLDEE